MHLDSEKEAERAKQEVEKIMRKETDSQKVYQKAARRLAYLGYEEETVYEILQPYFT